MTAKRYNIKGRCGVGVTVRSGVVLKMHGMINLTAEKGGQAIIHGMVNGTVWNYDHVTTYGTVDSIADCAPNYQTVIDPQAYTKGRQT